MKKYLLTACALGALFATPAQALRVTNLDTVPHTVTLEAAGTHFERSIPAGDTAYMVGIADGKLSLKTTTPKKTKSSVNADGLLSGVVGAGRDQDIPTDDQSNYVIWPGGQLLLQHRQQLGGRY